MRSIVDRAKHDAGAGGVHRRVDRASRAVAPPVRRGERRRGRSHRHADGQAVVVSRRAAEGRARPVAHASATNISGASKRSSSPCATTTGASRATCPRPTWCWSGSAARRRRRCRRSWRKRGSRWRTCRWCSASSRRTELFEIDQEKHLRADHQGRVAAADPAGAPQAPRACRPTLSYGQRDHIAQEIAYAQSRVPAAPVVAGHRHHRQGRRRDRRRHPAHQKRSRSAARRRRLRANSAHGARGARVALRVGPVREAQDRARVTPTRRSHDFTIGARCVRASQGGTDPQ